MDPGLRVVANIPIQTLWNDAGTVPAVRYTYLSRSSIKDILRAGPIEFVVADVGIPLRWIEKEACFDFWKQSAEPHLAEPDEPISLDCFAGGLAYLASLWRRNDERALILLEAFH